ncbi:MAG TPA: hypothetical protein VH877_01490 [Polyangia bacterium]|jgi:hypothetical protein|nr:hypothetical protein [Polyangia bacterium]
MTTLGQIFEPWRYLGDVVSLDPRYLRESFVLLGAFIFLNDLLRTALMAERPRSVAQHLAVCVLTLWPGILLGAVLLWAGYRHPEHAFSHLLFAALLYGFWILGGALTRLVRSDSEGADLGWISHGALITFPLGLLAVILW